MYSAASYTTPTYRWNKKQFYGRLRYNKASMSDVMPEKRM